MYSIFSGVFGLPYRLASLLINIIYMLISEFKMNALGIPQFKIIFTSVNDF